MSQLNWAKGPLRSQRLLAVGFGETQDAATGLRVTSWIMIERITAIRRDRLGTLLGRVPRETEVALDRALAVLLGIG